MRNRKPIDDLSIEELERVLATKKRQARAERLRRYTQTGRRPGTPLPEEIFTAEHDFHDDEDNFEGKDSAPRRSLRNRVLLLIELGAAGGLIALLVAVAFSLRELNLETVEAFALDTLPEPSATPLLRPVVLPSGHTPPTAPGGAQPNFAEVPENLQPLVEQAFFGPLPTVPTGPGTPTRITIPAIGIDAPVVEGTGWEQLKKGVGRQPGTGDPGQIGNMVLAAHNDIFGEIFRDLDQLNNGDEIIVQSTTRTFTYVIRDTRIVEPTEVSIMDPTQEPTTTLISCYPYLVDTQRIVVIAELLET